ncbi:MTH1187 family thiamine-binding protein [Ferviditalea candida]|uniref:MTH1187 family thiamine-binding protein n=1 Tax=Ferviditalea candida TaxID=3108399 RepID=A0ABU5ZMK7_9BACL|nr:MTH1187 family thiamine-binding protein [Paenibacillaceae bacterium T2]
MSLLEISVVPVGTGSASFSSQVAEAVQLIEQKGMKYQVTPTATIIEGSLDELMDMAKEIHKKALGNGTNRVITNISIDDRTDKTLDMKQQVDIVHQSVH